VSRFALAVAALLAPALLLAQTPLGTAFTYQGRLDDNGAAANGRYDLQFQLFDAATGGTALGEVALNNVRVASGLFTVNLDFGPVFSGAARWVQVGVRPGGQSGAFTILSPRQELTPAPSASYSLKAGDAATLGGLSCSTSEVPKWNGSAWACAAVTDTLAGLSCSSGEVAKWNGSAWACAGDVVGTSGGSVTSVAAGEGLTGGTITTSGTLAVSFAGTGGNLGSATTAARSDHGHGGTYLPATGASCPAGSSIQAINADGTVVCQSDNPQPVFSRTILDGVNRAVGEYTSITIGADGLGLISYYDEGNGDLKVAHCSDTACTSATRATLDGAGDVGQYTSVTVAADGRGLISYYDKTNGDLKVVRCSDTACANKVTTTTLDSSGDVGQYTSMTIGADGVPLISYSSGGLRVLHYCTAPSPTCTPARTTLDGGRLGESTSVTIGADGLALISYPVQGDLKVAHCSDTLCTSATTATLDLGTACLYPSVTIGADGLGLVSYYDQTNGDLKVAHCSDTACTSAATTTLDGAAPFGQVGTDVGLYTSVTTGADGLGLISYYDQTNGDLKVAHCSDTACTSAATTTVDSVSDVGRYTSVTIGTDGLGLISYYDFTNQDLKVAHCSNVLCNPYIRRR
jgi:cell shape-determining protein MreC